MFMMGIDAGASYVKIVTKEGVNNFMSDICPFRVLLVNGYGSDLSKLEPGDFVIEYKGETYYVGKVANRESNDNDAKPGGISKNHKETLIRTLVAVHQYGKILDNKVAICQPIAGMDEEEKKAIVDMLQGKHEVVVNSAKKTIEISEVVVSPECASAFFALEDRPEGIVNVVDAGSSTVNFCRVQDDFFVDKASGTINFGAENKISSVKFLAESVIAKTRSEWNKDEIVYVCGGVSEEIANHLRSHFSNVQLIKLNHFTSRGVNKYDGQYANAFGLYNIAKEVFGQ